MKKLKNQKITTLLHYKQFLKNNDLKQKIYKKYTLLFENPILYNNLNLESYIIEFNNYKNIALPFTLVKISNISTIKLKYKNLLLFNYNLTYYMLYQFNKIMFKTSLNPKTDSIKGRILGGNWNNKKIFISILGLIFSMKPINLNSSLNYKKKNYFSKYNKKSFYKKKKNALKLINHYKKKYLNFKINSQINTNNKIKKSFSRLSYIKLILKNKKLDNPKKYLRKQKSVLSS